MSIFKRLSATLVSSIDQVVGEIENHDAVVQATLGDMRKRIAEAKVRLGQVHREKERSETEIQKQQENVHRWKHRAVESAKDDETKALECVSRGRHCQVQVEKLKQSIQQYQQAAEKLASDIYSSEQRLAEVKQKLTLMRARQSTTSALHATSDSNHNTTQVLDDTFDRWEINISQSEMAIDIDPIVDPIEHEFVIREHEDELRNELQDLLTKEEEQ